MLYGTTWRGGGTGCVGGLGCGTVFKLTPPVAGQTKWTKEILYRFKGGSDGEAPFAGLVLDSKGPLYGTTSGGGGPSNCGTVFKLTPPAAGLTLWTETVLYSFAGTGDSCIPQYGRLIFNSKGALFGTTRGTTRVIGAASGTVFKLKPPQTQWTEKVLYSFKGGSDGSEPFAGLIFDSNGAQRKQEAERLLVPPAVAARRLSSRRRPAGQTLWTETVLHRFQGVAGGDGESPEGGLVFDNTGALYGTTSAGGNIQLGTVFKLTPPAPGHTKWMSDLPNGGANPIGEVLLCPVIGGQPACAPPPGGRPVSGTTSVEDCAELLALLTRPSGELPTGEIDWLLLELESLACG